MGYPRQSDADFLKCAVLWRRIGLYVYQVQGIGDYYYDAGACENNIFPEDPLRGGTSVTLVNG
jgi:hypothetical protein